MVGMIYQQQQTQFHRWPLLFDFPQYHQFLYNFHPSYGISFYPHTSKYFIFYLILLEQMINKISNYCFLYQNTNSKNNGIKCMLDLAKNIQFSIHKLSKWLDLRILSHTKDNYHHIFNRNFKWDCILLNHFNRRIDYFFLNFYGLHYTLSNLNQMDRHNFNTLHHILNNYLSCHQAKSIPENINNNYFKIVFMLNHRIYNFLIAVRYMFSKSDGNSYIFYQLLLRKIQQRISIARIPTFLYYPFESMKYKCFLLSNSNKNNYKVNKLNYLIRNIPIYTGMRQKLILFLNQHHIKYKHYCPYYSTKHINRHISCKNYFRYPNKILDCNNRDYLLNYRIHLYFHIFDNCWLSTELRMLIDHILLNHLVHCTSNSLDHSLLNWKLKQWDF